MTSLSNCFFSENLISFINVAHYEYNALTETVPMQWIFGMTVDTDGLVL